MSTAISEKVGAWLLKPGNSKAKMAEEMGITVGSLRNKLNGHTPWMWEEICAISDLTGCTTDDLRDKTA